jgi:sulfur relay (sulfurtransferase) complex TusBCD TusD component (DsrE family)
MNDTVIIITKQGLGTTSAEDSVFGIEMLDKFFHELERQSVKPKAICFYTEGVKVATQGSPIEISLKLLERLGVQLIICRTCLEHYGLESELVIGTVGGMVDIVRMLSEAEKVITI